MPYEVGQSYLFRTVGFHWVGRVVEVHPAEIVIDDAACVFDTGRYHLALREGIEAQEMSEIEPVDHPVVLNRAAVVDAARYTHALPRAAK